jgi:hypothetical protein
VVFSSTLEEPLAWENTRLVTGDAVEAVRDMKQQGHTDLRTIGSLTLCRSLLAAGLVDRFRVVVFPVVNGASGREPFYAGWPDVALETVEHRTFDGRLQIRGCRPRHRASPPPRRTSRPRCSAGSRSRDRGRGVRQPSRMPRRPPRPRRPRGGAVCARPPRRGGRTPGAGAPRGCRSRGATAGCAGRRSSTAPTPRRCPGPRSCG